MNFNEDDELDYEEDDPDNDSGNKNAAEDKTNGNSSILGSDDQYIQINCSEEEENFIDRIAVDSKNTEIQNHKKSDEESQKIELEKPQLGKLPCTQKNNNNSNNCNNGSNSNDNNNVNCAATNKKFKKKKWPFQHRLRKKNLPANILTFSSWLPEWNISSAYDLLKPTKEPVYKKQILNFGQDFYSNSCSQFPLLGLTASLGQNLPQLTGMGDRRQRHKNVKPNVIMRNKKSNNSLSAQNSSIKVPGFSDNYQICEAKKNFMNESLHQQNGKSADTDNKNFFWKNNNFFNGLYSSLKSDEKELVKLKKEARLKRFMNDDIVKKERKMISLSENETKDGLNLGEEYFQKLEEQKFAREKLLSFKEHQRKNFNFYIAKSVSVKKPDINKESLLKKKNPFDTDLGKSDCFLTDAIKQEKERYKEVEQKSPGKEQFSPQGLSIVKSEASSSVKFFRTVSKSFDELAVRKPKIRVLKNKEDESSLSNPVATFPFIATNEISCSRKIDLPTETEIQLTGCIVKVFNIPPSTTTNDILALCSPIGIVKEMKLNLPKENSVVIRFGEPACAENFFSIYHGQKMNNYFLNVIVI